MSARYTQLLGRMYEARRHGVQLTLDRMVACLSRLGRPDRCVPVRVQIAGTNGKGSTAAFLSSILRQQGLKVGCFSSPHLHSFCERIAVDGAPIDQEALLIAAQMLEQGDPQSASLTFFERATALAALCFASAGVDVAIYEVGLGGRFDATTAIEPHVAAVTSVSLDHETYLGTTIEAIAAEKAGVFRAGIPAVIAGSAIARGFLHRYALDRGAAPVIMVESAKADGYVLGLTGPHQRSNAACALSIVDALETETTLGSVSARVRRDGLRHATLPARFECISQRPRIMVDGAHNPAAAHALAEAIAGERAAFARCALILGIAHDKDVEGIVGALAPSADLVLATRAAQERACAPERIAAACCPHTCEVRIAPTVGRAMANAQCWAQGTDMIVVAGSLFVASEARAHVLGIAREEVELSDPL